MVRDSLEWEGWPQAAKLLARSVDRTDVTTMADIEGALKDSKAQLWTAIAGSVMLAGVTQLIETKFGKQCFIWQLGGSFEPCSAPLLAAVEKWARAEGCTSIEGNMRPGFERKLLDWEKVSVVMRKSL